MPIVDNNFIYIKLNKYLNVYKSQMLSKIIISCMICVLILYVLLYLYDIENNNCKINMINNL